MRRQGYINSKSIKLARSENFPSIDDNSCRFWSFFFDELTTRFSASPTHRLQRHTFYMKKKSYTTDLEARTKFEHLKMVTPVEQPNDNIKQMITRRIDKKVNLVLRKEPCISFYCPLSFVFSILGNTEPKKTSETLFYSCLESKYLECLEIEWIVEDFETAKKMFGDKAFSPRNYPDSNGVIDFRNKQGRELR